MAIFLRNAPRRKTIFNRFLISSVSLRYPKGKVEERRYFAIPSSMMLIAENQKLDNFITTFPFGEGGPLAVDEVEFDASNICAHHLLFAMGNIV